MVSARIKQPDQAIEFTILPETLTFCDPRTAGSTRACRRLNGLGMTGGENYGGSKVLLFNGLGPRIARRVSPAMVCALRIKRAPPVD